MIALSEPVRAFAETMPPAWRLLEFGETLSEPVRNGVYKEKEFHGRGAKVVNMGELFAHDFIDSQEMKRIEITEKEGEKYGLKEGDLLFARRSLVLEGSGKCSLVRKPAELTTFESSLIRARPNPSIVESQFLFYLFTSPLGRAAISSIATRTAVSGIRGSELSKLALPIPDLPTQRRISSILSAYDDLIENNLRRIRILEEMAQSLYREWFVHFRYPGHESAVLVDSPLGPIPDGWEVRSLETIQANRPNAINGGPFGSKLGRKDYVDDGVPVIRGGNLSLEGRFNDSDYVFVSEQKADELRANIALSGDIVVTQRGTLGQIAIIPKTSRYERFVISQSQMKITVDPAKVNQYYLFNFLRSQEATGRLINQASSSGVPHINLATLREFLALLPPRQLQVKFGTTAKAAEESIECIQRRIQILRQTRDLLLPKLLSGSAQ